MVEKPMTTSTASERDSANRLNDETKPGARLGEQHPEQHDDGGEADQVRLFRQPGRPGAGIGGNGKGHGEAMCEVATSPLLQGEVDGAAGG
ncbi:hypothetical protein [Kaistia sp. MMO-174]|uniref:hypothetical protein n=1 Tax=Kaistia sp. MMO-174 TaxID=3081256 RepID=UPI00301B61BF